MYFRYKVQTDIALGLRNVYIYCKFVNKLFSICIKIQRNPDGTNNIFNKLLSKNISLTNFYFLTTVINSSL